MESKEQLIELYKQYVATRGDERFTKDEFLKAHDLDMPSIFRAGFANYQDLEISSRGTNPRGKQLYSDDELLSDLRRVMAEEDANSISMERYDAIGKFSSKVMWKRFGSWTIAQQRAKGEQPGSATPPASKGAKARSSKPNNYQKSSGNELGIEFLSKFTDPSRQSVSEMAGHYSVLYCLERQMRDIVTETLEKAHGPTWWDLSVPQQIRDDAKRNKDNEDKLGVTNRSSRFIDYTTLGQLGNIVDANWNEFCYVFNHQQGLARIMRDLNMLRAFVAHCSPLPADEVKRLDLCVSDWIRQLKTS